MRIGIDASNIREGGGFVHLQNILNFAKPEKFGIKKIVVWGNKIFLDGLTQKSWLDRQLIPISTHSLYKRLFWQKFKLTDLAHKYCDLLFVPGGTYTGFFIPYVSMIQNMQVFETKERNREGFSRQWIRLILLKWIQSITFKKASGLIFLSEYSLNYFTQYLPLLNQQKNIIFIPHGNGIINCKNIKFESEIHKNKKIKILYVSTVKKYKHQWNLIDAIGQLNKEGAGLELHLIGGGDPNAIVMMRKAIQRNQSFPESLFYHGSLSKNETLKWYYKSDIFVFASTCETFGISLLEAMSVGLPIASSNRGPTSEILKDSGLYFNPESINSIKTCLKYLIKNPDLRKSLGQKAKIYSKAYSWEKCSDETFSFLRNIYNLNKK